MTLRITKSQNIEEYVDTLKQLKKGDYLVTKSRGYIELFILDRFEYLPDEEWINIYGTQFVFDIENPEIEIRKNTRNHIYRPNRGVSERVLYTGLNEEVKQLFIKEYTSSIDNKLSDVISEIKEKMERDIQKLNDALV